MSGAIKSASLVVVVPSRRILFMLRPSRGSFPNTHVFPGGALEPEDRSLAHCALRETFEETGLLIDPVSKQGLVVEDAVPRDYEKALAKHMHRELPTGIVLPRLSEWTTPAQVNNKRFTTQFFLYEAPTEYDFAAAKASSESVRTEWIDPAELLAQFQQRKISLFPPQFYIATQLTKKPLSQVAKELGNRVVVPAFLEKLDGGRTRYDWGQGEEGVLEISKGGCLSIEYYKNKSRL